MKSSRPRSVVDPASVTASRLARLRRRARFILTCEALIVAALAPLGVIALVLIATLLGAGGWRCDLVGLLALIPALIWARRHYHPPHPQAIDRRIERDSRLAHRPIAAFEDRMASADPVGGVNPLAVTLWQAHRERTDAALRTARIGLPAPDFAAHDPFALRALVLLGLIGAWIAAGNQAGLRLASSLSLPRLFGGGHVAVQAWATPPGWTGEAPILVEPGRDATTLLSGSSLSLILTGGGSSPPAAALGAHGIPLTSIAGGSYRATMKLTEPATLTIGPFWNRIARYRLIVAAPVAPIIGFTTPPHGDPDGKRTDFAWRATSPYGLTRLELVVSPGGHPEARPEAAAVPHRSPAKGDALLDLLASPYAGMAVEAELVATNKAGQIGRSSGAPVILPAPVLHNATAQALEAIRRELALDPAARPALAAKLDTIGRTPPGPVTPGTRRAIAAFARPFATGTAPHPEAQLWSLVQRAEQGAAFRTAKQLAAARRALEAALKQALAGHPPAAATLQKLLARLNAASQAHLAAQGQAAPTQAQLNAMAAISALAQRIAHEEAAGNTAQAKADLAKLRAMLRQMQQQKPLSAAQEARQRAARQAQGALSKLMQQEARLMDQTAQQAQPDPAHQAMGNQAGQPPSPQDQALAQAQQALQQQLGNTATSLAQAGIPPGPQIGQGQQAMQSATAALRQGNAPGALPAERAAVAALQQAQGALQAMQTGKGTGGGPSGLGQHASGGHGEYGNQNHGVVSLGRAGAKSDARTIQNELIKRDAAPDLPAPAHRYYRRLLGKDF